MGSRPGSAALLRFVFACAALYGLSYGLVGPTLPAIAVTFGLNYTEAGLVGSALTLGLPLTSLAVGLLAERLPARDVLIAGLAGFALGLSLMGLASVYGLILIGALSIGLAAGLVEVNLATLTARLRTGSTTVALSRMYVFTGLGALISPLYAGWLLQLGSGWRLSYGLTAFFCMVVASLALRLPLKSVPTTAPGRPAQVMVFSLLRRWSVIFWLLAVFIYGGVQWGIISWLAAYLQQMRGLSPFWASAAVSAVWGAEVVGRFLYGLLPWHWSEGDLIIGSTSLATPLLLLALTLISPPLIFIALIISSLMFAPVWPALIAYAGRAGGEHLTPTTSLAMTSASTGTIIAPVLMGVVASYWSLPVAIYGVVIALGLLIPLLLLAETSNRYKMKVRLEN